MLAPVSSTGVLSGSVFQTLLAIFNPSLNHQFFQLFLYVGSGEHHIRKRLSV